MSYGGGGALAHIQLYQANLILSRGVLELPQALLQAWP